MPPSRSLVVCCTNSWELKRRLSDQIAPPFVDDIYRRAMEAGALGGKLLGAGGGGFMLFFVRPKHQARVCQALSELLLVPVQLDWSGTQLIFYDPPQYSQTAHKRRDYKRYANGERDERVAKPALRAPVLRVIHKNPRAAVRLCSGDAPTPIEPRADGRSFPDRRAWPSFRACGRAGAAPLM